MRAAQYVRMSTDQQQYSITNQSAAIALYAAAHGMGIIRSYADAGKSGVTIKGRDALQDLIHTVQGGNADFAVILVYDVSRWGRFPDADEAAHYEFICKKAGVQVRYCAEQFDNDNSSTSNLLKALKRMMAGEYSRELGVKTIAGQRRLAAMGFRQGGVAPFGLQNQVVDQHGNPKRVLSRGERKGSGGSDRITLVPGRPEDVRVVRKVFRLFARYKELSRLCDCLNGPRNPRPDHKWTKSGLASILQNPAYIGSNVFCRRDSRTLKLRPKEEWIVREKVFQPIIGTKQFAATQELFRLMPAHTNERLLEKLSRILRKEGRLSGWLIEKYHGKGSHRIYQKRFGNLDRAYELVGFACNKDDNFQGHIRKLRQRLVAELSSRLIAGGATVSFPPKLQGLLVVNDQLILRIAFVPAHESPSGEIFWRMYNHSSKADIAIFVRLTARDATILDYFFIPRIAGLGEYVQIFENEQSASSELFRMDNLERLAEKLRMSWVREGMWDTE